MRKPFDNAASTKSTCSIVADPHADFLSPEDYQRLVQRALDKVKELHKQGYRTFQSLLHSGVEVAIAHTILNADTGGMEHICYEPYELWHLEQVSNGGSKEYTGLYKECVGKSTRRSGEYGDQTNESRIHLCMTDMLENSSALIVVGRPDWRSGLALQAKRYASLIGMIIHPISADE